MAESQTYGAEENRRLDLQLDGVHMSVHWAASGRLGIAWYDASTREISCFEGQDDGAAPQQQELTFYRLLQQARLHILPSAIYASSKAPEDLLRALRAPLLSPFGTTVQESTEPEDAQQAPVRVERAKLFTLESARAALEAVRLPSMPAGIGPRQRLHIINSTMNLQREQQVCAVGALLSVLNRDSALHWGRGGGAEDGGAPLVSIKESSLAGHLLVDPGSLEALQIFQEEAHPSAMGIGRAKEGLSVFGVLNRCITPPGRKMLRLWFARPLVDVAKLEERLDGVEALLKVDIDEIRIALRGVKDPCRQLARLQGMQTLPDPADFMALQSSIAALLALRDAVRDLALPEEQHLQRPQGVQSSLWNAGGEGGAQRSSNTTALLPLPPVSPGAAALFARLADAITDDLVAIHQLIAGVIDCEQASDGMAVHYGVSAELDEMKALYFGLPDLLKQVQVHEVSRLPMALQGAARSAWSVVYVPQMGFMLQVEGPLLGADVLEQLRDISVAMPHGVFQGGDGRSGACYHTATTRELGDRYGDVLHKIRDLETAICNQVAQRAVAAGHAVREAAAAAAEVDCLLSLAGAAGEMGLTRPVLTEENVLEICGGRHLLAETVLLCGGGGKYIPNNTRMGLRERRVHVITGPNASGKSCYAKQVAVIAFLAHVGSFVPAEAATVGLVDRIFTRVATREAGAVPQSAFLIDLSQVAAMLRLATHRSLLIIDEFGKGTLTADGVGLLCGALGSLAARAVPPRVLLTTHFTEVLNPQYLHLSPQLDFHTMAVIVPGQDEEQEGGRSAAAAAGQNNDDIVFLYRLVPGYVGPSFGVHCAALAGVAPEVVDRAKDVIDCAAKGQQMSRAAMPELERKGTAFKVLAARLLALDLHDGGSSSKVEVWRLLRDAAEAVDS